jgi:hypothetical protein
MTPIFKEQGRYALLFSAPEDQFIGRPARISTQRLERKAC